MRLRCTRRAIIKLHEFQARDLLVSYGCAIPRGIVAASEKEAREAAQALGGSVVVKAQVLSGGRAKLGGVLPADSPETVREAARVIFSKRINGFPVKRVLVVEALRIKHEYYASILVNRRAKLVQCMVSAAGGIDIEIVAQNSPEKIITIAFPPLTQAQRFEPKDSLTKVFGDHVAAAAAGTILAMHRLFYEKDCALVEVNPLVLTNNNTLVAADAKIVIDDNALYKHPDIEALCNDEEYSDEERAARRAGLSFVGLEGSIGCIVNGAGLAMATMDLITLSGGRPANFLDVGGSSSPQKVLDAFKILLSNKNIKVILVNIFGGITRCDDIARGILMAKQEMGIALPIIVRFTGTNEDQARDLLNNAEIAVHSDMAEAIRRAVSIEGGPL